GGATRSEGIGAFFCGLTRVSGAVSRFGTSSGAFVVGGGVGRSTLSFGFFTRAALSELGVIAFVVGAEVTGPLSLFFFSGGGVAPSVIPVGGGVLVGGGFSPGLRLLFSRGGVGAVTGAVDEDGVVRGGALSVRLFWFFSNGS